MIADGTDQAEREESPPGGGRRRTWLVAGLAVVLLAAGVGAAVALSGSGGGAGGGLVGHAAPAFSVDQLQGSGKLSLASAGGRPVVLNFWASWCDPCKQEMPAFEAEHKVLGDRVAFVGIDTKDNHDDGVAFLQRVGVDYLAGFDLLGATADKYGLIGMPTTFLIRPDGQVVYRHTGGLSQATLDGLVRRYFG